MSLWPSIIWGLKRLCLVSSGQYLSALLEFEAKKSVTHAVCSRHVASWWTLTTRALCLYVWSPCPVLAVKLPSIFSFTCVCQRHALKRRKKYRGTWSDNRTKRDRWEKLGTHVLKQIGQDGVDWIHVSWYRERWREM
jgi:hypothetical protein